MRRFALPLVGLMVLVGLLLFRGQASTLEPTTFVDVSTQVGINFSNQVPSSCLLPFSTGSAWADYDNDGDVDLYITNQGGNNALYRNDGDTNSDGLPDFTDVAAAAGVTVSDGVSIASVFIDYDNDNDNDLYVTNWDDDGVGTAFTGNILFQNRLTETGSATFLDVTASAGAGLDDGGVGNRSAWGDFDNDGFLDMYLTNHGDPESCPVDPDNQDHLFHNDGDGTFTEVTEYVCNGSATCAEVEGLGFSPGWVDFDNDGDLDLYLVNDILTGSFHENVLWRNDGSDGSGGWTFTDITAAAGADLTINGMGLGVGDYDNDGWLDFAMSDGGPAELLRNLGNGTFADTAVSSGVNGATSGSITWGTVFFDHDNDGWLDLYFAAGGLGSPGLPNIFLGNNQDGTFVDLSSSSGLDHGQSGKNVSIVDFDNDGFVDVLVNSYDGQVALYHNQGNANNWLTVTVEGSTSNADAIGTRLELTANGITQIREINDGPSHGGGDYKMAHFGLDDASSGTLTVRWPNGVTENLGTVSANQKLHLAEPNGGGPVAPTTFTDVATQVGLNTTHTLDLTACGDGNPPISNGSAWADYDNDGDQDLYMTNQATANHLYRNDGDTNSDGLPDFTDVAVAAGVDDLTAVGLGAVFVDYDNDGDQDLYVTNWDDAVGMNRLFENQLIETGSATFNEIANAAGVNDTGRAITAAWADFDQDSFLDLYIAKHSRCLSGDRDPQDRLFHNNGDGTFTDVSGWLCDTGVAPCDQLTGQGFSPGWFDFDNDADLDLFLINDYGGQFPYHNVLWRNDGSDGQGGWNFTDVTTSAGLDTTNIAGMGLGIGDYDNDGWFDLAWSDVGPVWLAHNEGNGTFTDSSSALGTTGGTTWGTVFFDHENDMWLDLYYVSGAIAGGGIQNLFFGNNQNGTFTNLSVSSGLNDMGRGRSASIADFDEDGFVDVMVGNYGENYVLFHNDAGNGANWLTVTVEGTVSNRDGIGTRLTLTADGVTQMREITTGPTHGGGDQKAAFFGLGTASSGTLTVRWPNGVVENLGVVSANQQLHLIEPGTSPPTPTPGPTSTPTNTPPAPTATNTPGPTATPTNTSVPPTPTNTPDSSGGTFTFTAVADAAALSNRADNNYGGPLTLATDGSPIINSYLRFDVQGLTGSITSATLRVWAGTTNSIGIDGAGVSDNSWGETTITFNNAPAAGAVLGSSGATTAEAWAEIDVISFVTGDGLVSFMISTSDAGRISFDSREATNDPELVIVTSGGPSPTATNTPVPPTATNTPVPTDTPTVGPSPTLTNTPEPGGGQTLYVSSTTNGNADGVAFADEDVLVYDTDTASWAMRFDGSDLGISRNDLDAFFQMADGSLLISFVRAQDIGSLTGVDDSDIVRFVPTSLGDTTAGTFEMYFDGSDVDLVSSGEDVDAVGFAPDGRIIISTLGNYSAGGLTGAGNDLLVLDNGVFGDDTSGIWALYFDGEDVELTDSTENISGVWIDAANGDIYLATSGAFTVTGASGDGADIFVCTPGTLGDSTTCTYALFWDGSANGFDGEVIDGLAIAP